MNDVQPPKPGWQTTEFWLTAAAVVINALASAGLFDDQSGIGRGLAAIAAALAALGYAGARAWMKHG